MRDSVDSEQAAHLGLRAIEAGIGVALLGQPYSGRSTTIQRLAALAAESGFTVTIVRGIPQLRSYPFAALSAAGVGASSAAPLTLQSAVADLSGANRLIVVDDVASLDSHSLGAVIEASRRSGRPLIVAGRTTQDLSPGWSPMILTLSGITYVDTLAIVKAELGGQVSPGVVRRIHSKSGGLPGLAVKLTRIAKLEGTLRDKDGAWTAAPRLWTPSMRGLIAPFLDGLSPSDVAAMERLISSNLTHVDAAQEAVGTGAYQRLLEAGRIREFTIAHAAMFTVFPPLITEYFRSPGEHADGPSDFAERTDVTAVAGLAQADWRREVDRLALHHPHPVAPASAVRTIKTAIAAGADLDLIELARTIAPSTEPENAAVAVWQAFAWSVRGSKAAAEQTFIEARAEHPAFEEFVLSAQAHARFVLDAALPSTPADPPHTSEDLNDDGWTVVRAEIALARGHMREAREALESLSPTSNYFLGYADALECLLLLLDGQIDGAVSRSLSAVEDALAQHELELISMYGYVAAVSLYTAGRDQELAVVLDLLLSVIVRTPSMHGGYTMGILGCAASFESDEKRLEAAGELVSQMTTVGPGPAAWPFASRLFTLGVARNTAGDLAAAANETEASLDAGRAAAGLVHESIIGWLQPTLVDVDRVRAAIASTDSPLLTRLGELAVAAAEFDHASLERVSDALGALGSYRAAVGARVVAALHGPDDERPERLFAVVAWAIEHELDIKLVKRVVPMNWIFSARELQIVSLATANLSNREIAERLTISVRTVEGHLRGIYRKMSIASRDELPSRALFT